MPMQPTDRSTGTRRFGAWRRPCGRAAFVLGAVLSAASWGPWIAPASVAFLAIAGGAHAQETGAANEAEMTVPAVTDSYRSAVEKMLRAIGAETTSEQLALSMAQETLGAIASTGTQVTEQIQTIVVDEAIKEFKGKFGGIEHLTDLYAPLYVTNLSEADIHSITAFYESEAGRKMISVLPQITQTAMYTLQQQSLERLPDFQEKVDAKLREAGIIVVP